MSNHSHINGPEYFHRAEEFCHKSGPLNRKSVKTPKAAVLNGLELVAAALASLGVLAAAIILYITSSALWISTDSATINANVFNRADGQQVTYVLTLANDPENRMVAGGILDEDESRLHFTGLASGTTYRITYFTIEEGELVKAGEYEFTTRGEAPDGPSSNPVPGDFHAPGDNSDQNPPARDPAPKPEDTPSESSSEPAILPQSSQPPRYPAPGGDDEEESGSKPTTPATSTPEEPEPEEPATEEGPVPTVDQSILNDAIVETVYPYEPDYESFKIRYYPSSVHSFILPDGVTLEDIVCYSDDVQASELPEDDSTFEQTYPYYTYFMEYPYVGVTVYSDSVYPGKSVKNRVVLYLSDGSTVEAAKTLYMPAFVDAPEMSVTETIDGKTATYVFQITGSVFCPADSSLKLEAYGFTTSLDPSTYIAFSPINVSGNDEVKPFTFTSQTITSTALTHPGLIDETATVMAYWSAVSDGFPLSAECGIYFEPTDIYSITTSGDIPVTNSSLPVTDSAVTGPPVRLPDGISNVAVNADGSCSYTETHIFRDLPGDVTAVTIERNGSPSSVGYQSIRSGDTLTVILDRQTLAPGASSTGRVSITCSGQSKPLRSTITVSADTLRAAAG